MIAAIAIDDSCERCPWQKVHQLREQGFAGVHVVLSGNVLPKVGLKARWHSSRHHEKATKNTSQSCTYVIEMLS